MWWFVGPLAEIWVCKGRVWVRKSEGRREERRGRSVKGEKRERYGWAMLG